MRAVLAALFSIACLAAHAEGLPLRMDVQGSGERTVIFEAGLGDNYSVWQQVQSKIANRCARTVSYTRAGYPGSPQSRAPRDAETIVDELRAALHNRGIEPPYVLVGSRWVGCTCSTSRAPIQQRSRVSCSSIRRIGTTSTA
jgi:hypothetical protein